MGSKASCVDSRSEASRNDSKSSGPEYSNPRASFSRRASVTTASIRLKTLTSEVVAVARCVITCWPVRIRATGARRTTSVKRTIELYIRNRAAWAIECQHQAGTAGWERRGSAVIHMSHALTLAVAIVSPSQSVAQTHRIRTLGSFPWDTSSADVLLQRVSSDRLVVQVRIVTESIASDARQPSTRVRRRTRAVPTESMEAWVLLDDGTALRQTPRQPPSGSSPPGVVNAGATYSFVSFGFTSASDTNLSAVVVKMERFHVFRS
jgi:hypothetical protein